MSSLFPPKFHVKKRGDSKMNRTALKRCIIRLWLIFRDSNSLIPQLSTPTSWTTLMLTNWDTKQEGHKVRRGRGDGAVCQWWKTRATALTPKQTSSLPCTSPPLSPFLLCHTSPSVTLPQGIPVMYVKWVCVSGWACLPSRWSYFLSLGIFCAGACFTNRKISTLQKCFC